MDEKLDKFIEQNGVVFELRAINYDGEELSKYSSTISADDVASYHELVDEDILKMALEDTDDGDFSEGTGSNDAGEVIKNL